MGYTNSNVLNSLQELVRELFKSNAIVDNIVYSLDVDLGFPILSDNIHHKIAHAYGGQADIITDFLSLRGDRIYRGNECIDPEKHSTVLDCLAGIIDVQENLEDMIKESISVAVKNSDILTEDMLRSYYKDVVILYTKQAHKLYNMASKFNEDGLLPLFDEESEAYFIVG